jgi:hypothetical protein
VRAVYSLVDVDLKTLDFRKMMTTPPHIEEDATEFEVHHAALSSDLMITVVAWWSNFVRAIQ